MNIRHLSKLHLLTKIALFGIFATKFFDNVYSHALKILRQICTKRANFIKRSEFRKKSIARTTLILFMLSCTPLFAKDMYQLFVGPEIYHMQKERASGTTQEGRIDGVRITLERLKRYKIYLAADYLYAMGSMKGKNSINRTILSSLTDKIFEARIGYCLQKNPCKNDFFVPFAGLGYFDEINHFIYPSPLPVTFQEHFSYILFGFLSGYDLCPQINIGLNFKMLFMHDARCEVSNDPFLDEISLKIKDLPYFRLELPICYSICGYFRIASLRLMPFYEFRHFGGQEGFPCNYIDTRCNIFGVNASLNFIY